MIPADQSEQTGLFGRRILKKPKLKKSIQKEGKEQVVQQSKWLEKCVKIIYVNIKLCTNILVDPLIKIMNLSHIALI